jgi:hypothetical protein
MNFYINFNLSNTIKSEERQTEFLKHPYKRHSSILKQRSNQFKNLLNNFDLSSTDVRWFSKTDGRSVGGNKIFIQLISKQYLSL